MRWKDILKVQETNPISVLGGMQDTLPVLDPGSATVTRNGSEKHAIYHPPFSSDPTEATFDRNVFSIADFNYFNQEITN